jgi:cyclopropane-fatty-acyl-phospholipid synthase
MIMKQLLQWVEQGRVPDWLVREGIRRLSQSRLDEEFAYSFEERRERLHAWVESLRKSPLAIETKAANEQHYEVPTEFYQLCLGPALKYSSAYYPDLETSTLAEAEQAMFDLYFQRAELADGQRILELGCGWGSLSLEMARRLPNARITGVSNSRTQRQHIMAEAARRGIDNLEIITSDVNHLELDGPFDRVVSIEMFEHLRNYQRLFERISHWLAPGGLLFFHVFCHREISYPFDVRDESDWMSANFFTGGLMPSEDLYFYFQDHLSLVRHWRVNGRHYGKTSEHWLENLDRNAERAKQLLGETYGQENAITRFNQWRVFFLSCAEFFAYKGGEEWFVSHYLFRNRKG